MVHTQTKTATDSIRFLAILLITNSHLDRLYPVPQLATGGAVGNALFFMVSGYGLAKSLQNMPRPFPAWYYRRIMRLYPSVLVVTILLELLARRRWEHWGVTEYLSAIIWPTHFWFVSALMLFYPLFYLVAKRVQAGTYLVVIAFLAIPYGYYYLTGLDLSRYTIEGPGYFKWIFYCQVMLFGGYLGARNSFKRDMPQNYSAGLFVLIVLYLGLGYLFHRGIFTSLQVLMHLLTFPIIYLVFFLAHTDHVLEKIMMNKAIHRTVQIVAGVTLELYLLQFYVYSNPAVQKLVFPLNILLFTAVLFLLSVAVARTAEYIRSIRPLTPD